MSGTTTDANANSTAAEDVVAVFDSNFNQLFSDARPMTADVFETVKVMQHPVETGAEIVDHKVIQPTKIRLSMTLTPETFVDTYEQIRALKKSNDTYQIQTKTALYSSMVLSEMPHKEDAAHYDTITIQLTFIEVRFVTVSTSVLPTSTVNAGSKQASQSSATDAANGTEKVSKSSAGYSLIFGKGKTADATND